MAGGQCCGSCRHQSAVQHSPLVICLVTTLCKPQPFPINLFYMADCLSEHEPALKQLLSSLGTEQHYLNMHFGFTDFLLPCAYNLCCFLPDSLLAASGTWTDLLYPPVSAHVAFPLEMQSSVQRFQTCRYIFAVLLYLLELPRQDQSQTASVK